MNEGLRLMVVGMTTVFAFLGLLVMCMHASAAFFRVNAGWFAEPAAPEPRLPTASGDDAEIAVVLAAIAAHRAGSMGSE